MAGRLLVIGTPIGNLGDLSPRASQALAAADLIVAEDTRVAARLLSAVGVRRPTSAFHEHNAEQRLPGLLARLAAGETIALTTDAGMPGVSDPGARLVAAAREAGHAVQVIPGPSAVTAAMALAGVESLGFIFGGFLPARPASARREALERLLQAAGGAGLPLVLFEAPTRIVTLLGLVAGLEPEARVAVGRELTKVHEEVLVGTPGEVAARVVARGEFTVVISGIQPRSADGIANSEALLEAARGIGLPDRAVVELLRAAGLGRREAYARVHGKQSQG
jgi:16S rRNA (cytidine1402-2'-O)-methyltransferase